jgi:DNA-binding CsgD family transcriptional regulator
MTQRSMPIRPQTADKRESRSDWPLIGREEELKLLRDLRCSVPPMSAVVTGPPGVGKSILASVATAEAANEGWATLEIRGSAGFSGVPLGPLRTVLRIPSSSDLATLAVSIEDELVAMRSSKGLFVLANDCQDLDEHTAGLLHQLVSTRVIVCILTVRSGAHLHAALTDLWKDNLAQRLELQNLSQRETTELLAVALAGNVRDSSVHRIWQTTGGNPLYVREVVLSSLETGALKEINGEWRWRGAWATGARLKEIVAARIGRLDPDASMAMEMIALAGSLPVSLVSALTTSRAVEELEERALVTIERSGRRLEVTITNPLHTEVLRGQMPALRQRAMLHTLVDALTSAGVRRNADRVRLACWSLEAGLPVDPMTLALGTDAAMYGIAHAISGRLSEIFPSHVLAVPSGEGPAVRQDFDVAIRLAETAFENTGALAEGVALAEALAWTGAVGRAEAVLADLVGRVEDRDDRARLTLALAWVRFWGRYEVDAAVDALLEVTADDGCDPGLRAEAYQQLAGIALNTAQPAAALAYAEHAAAAEGLELSRSIAAPPAAAALGYLGRCGDAIALVDQAVPFAQESERTLAVAMLLFAKAGALAGAGALEEARALASWLRDVGLSNDLVDAAAVFGVLLGHVLVRQGRPASAGRILRDSSGLFAEHDTFGYRPWALVELARAKSLIGQEGAAASALAEASGLQHLVRHFEGSRYMAEIELHHLAGRSAAAVDVAREGATWARDAGMILDEANVLDAWMRIAPSPELADRLAELARLSDSQLVDVLGDHAQALVDESPEALLATSERFAAMTAWWMATEAAAAAARLFDERHQARASASAARSAAGFASRCEGARTSSAQSVGGPMRLTRRENEIASLAAAGRSSQEIAGRLNVSRRTVESHLHHAYVKLGVTDRTELAAALHGPNSQ